MEIRTGAEVRGRIDFPSATLPVERTAEGFKILLPISVTLIQSQDGAQVPILSNVHGTFSTAWPPDPSIEVGTFAWRSSYRGPSDRAPGSLEWRGSLSGLAFFEQLRRGRPPKFLIRVWGDVASVERQQGQADKLCYVPETFYDQETVDYPAETWADALRRLRIIDIVMVEVPLPSESPEGWKGVWDELLNAKSELARGGDTAWRGCAGAVRRALEEWRCIEQESNSDKKPMRDKSKSERFDELRRSLKNYADRPLHASIDDCSREEAALMLATLSALLAVRKP